jgi:hypothetical protein
MKDLRKTDLEIIEIAHKIIDRSINEILSCKIKDDTIIIKLKDRVIIMSNLYDEYYTQEIIYNENGVTFKTENILNYAPCVNALWEINTNRIDRKVGR